jgi:hypothetical protein
MNERSSRWPVAVVALLAFASSIVGIVNQFTYDDRYIVQRNTSLRDLLHWWRVFLSSYWPREFGGDGYRPLTMLAFKIEYAIGGGQPMVFHATNILLYTITAVLVFLLARRLLPEWAAILTGACFAVHPVHVEAVANVVGQSELLVAAALLPAIALYLRDRMAGPLRPRTAAAIAGLFAVACFSKEHGIVLPGILLAAELTVISDPAPWRERVRRDRPFYLVLTLVAVIAVAVRSSVLSDHSLGGFQPFIPFSGLHISNRDRVLTAVSVVPQWVRLLYWPVHLSSEYGPPDIPIAQGFSVDQLPGLALLVAIIALAVVLRRRQPVVSFGIAFVCIALLPSSNFLLPAGIVLAERTLFLPSVGAMLVLGAVAIPVFDALERRVAPNRMALRFSVAAGALLIAAAMYRSIQRTMVWRDNDRLFHQAVIDSPRAYRAHFMLGALHFELKRKRDGEAEFRKALALFPYDPFMAYDLAQVYYESARCAPAIPLYRWAFGLRPESPLARGGLAWCLLNEGAYTEAKAVALRSMHDGSEVRDMRRVIFLADSVLAADSGATAARVRVPSKTSGKVPDSVQKARARTPAGPGI